MSYASREQNEILSQMQDREYRATRAARPYSRERVNAAGGSSRWAVIALAAVLIAGLAGVWHVGQAKRRAASNQAEVQSGTLEVKR